jgi:anti-sigma factor RsiW
MTDARDFDLELDMLSAYLDGELTDAERAAVEQRLEGSAEWRAELAQVESARAIVRGLPVRDAPPGFWDRVLAHVEAETATEVAASGDRTTTVEVAPAVPISAARGARRGTTSSRGRVVTWLAGTAAAIVAVVVVVALPGQDTVTPNVTAVATQHGASTSNSGDPISGLVPVGPLAGLRR